MQEPCQFSVRTRDSQRACRGDKTEPDVRPTIGAILGVHRPAMASHDLVNDREAETRSWKCSRMHGPVKPVEEVVSVFGGDSVASVPNRNRQPVDDDVDGRVGRAVFDGVLDEVADGPFQLTRAAVNELGNVLLHADGSIGSSLRSTRDCPGQVRERKRFGRLSRSQVARQVDKFGLKTELP